MSLIAVRPYDCTVGRDKAGQPCLGDAHPRQVEVKDVRITRGIGVNALATLVRRDLRYKVYQHELRLLLSYLRDAHSHTKDLGLRKHELASSAAHIQRFVSESVGMALLSALAECMCGWRPGSRAVAHFDVLPKDLAAGFSKRGARPDLLFRMPSGDLAGEARGRSTPASKSVTAEQRTKFDQLLGWSERHGGHPFVMTWACLTAGGTTVDLFRVVPGGSLAGGQSDVGEIDQSDVEVVGGFAPGAEVAVQRGLRQLYVDAPEGSEEQRLFGRRVRGSWVPLDLVGAADAQLFAGLFDQPLRAEEVVRVEQARERYSEAPFDIDVADSLVIALAPSDRTGEPPSWYELREYFG